MKKPRKPRPLNRSDWLTLRVLYPLLAMRPANAVIEDVIRVMDDLRKRCGHLQIEQAFNSIWQETKGDIAYELEFRATVKQVLQTINPEEK